ncbi:hypothetical protein PHLGIDRAFT_349127 [Phlebiopsis gigantea 11061_1 CR5-6]|uniref:Ubiquitin 3 binding protein But2 C-terminal domain-containing protein n=1 Tax=Phlebiopsis gigantea (strain 11061_1 CR5-6) TaxID=745531 RepID=A0A0C3RYY7_PHLG1|nr:hypothetical protein PHLGIDRAFT_349127 [Phlebiopsis gigantea 11061_1 CR5-6]
MVFRTTVVVLTAVAAAVSAAPSVLRKRQGPSSYNPTCEGTPAGSRAFVNDFRLTALNTTLPNANTTGVPLVIGSVSATTGAESYSLSTYASYPYNQRPNLELFEGRLFAWGSDQYDAVAGVPLSGSVLEFIAPPQGISEQAFCVTPRGSDLYSLAVNGDTTSWSLCPDGHSGGQVRVVYNATENSNGCYSIELLLSDATVA